MGMLRDMKEMVAVLRSDDLKELKRTADAQPRTSMLEGVRMANDAAQQATQWTGAAGALGSDPAANMAAYASARPAQATVQAITETGTEINGAPLVDLDLMVTLPGEQPYPVRHRQLIAVTRIPSFQPGSSFPVRVDPRDRSTIAIG